MHHKLYHTHRRAHMVASVGHGNAQRQRLWVKQVLHEGVDGFTVQSAPVRAWLILVSTLPEKTSRYVKGRGSVFVQA